MIHLRYIFFCLVILSGVTAFAQSGEISGLVTDANGKPINGAFLIIRPNEKMIQTGFGTDAAGEDRFDSLIGLLGLIGVIDGKRPDFIPEDPMIRAWEGWVLGQTALPH
jgi:hypothetical protein